MNLTCFLPANSLSDLFVQPGAKQVQLGSSFWADGERPMRRRCDSRQASALAGGGELVPPTLHARNRLARGALLVRLGATECNCRIQD